MENPLEQLISTIERNAVNDKVEIPNVKVWAERWRVEFKGTIEDLIAETELEDYTDSMKLNSIAQTLQSWLDQMNPNNQNQLNIPLDSKGVFSAVDSTGITSVSEGNGL